MTEYIHNLLHEAQKLLGDFYGHRLIKSFCMGPRRGDASPNSDVDLMIVLEGPVHAGEEIARTGN